MIKTGINFWEHVSYQNRVKCPAKTQCKNKRRTREGDTVGEKKDDNLQKSCDTM
jgi:hypothetical protein